MQVQEKHFCALKCKNNYLSVLSINFDEGLEKFIWGRIFVEK